MVRPPDDSERTAFEMVRRVTGAEVEHYDTAGRQGAVDGLIHYADGPAALEVTMLTDEHARQLETLLNRDEFTWTCPGANWWWTLAFGPRADIRRTRTQFCEVITWCEANSVTRPANWWMYGPGMRHVPTIAQWLELSDVELVGHPDVRNHPGQVMVVPAGNGGVVGDMATVLDWLQEEMRADRTLRKVEKILADDRRRGELFLIIDDTGAPFETFYALAFGDGVPGAAPEPIPTGLESIWLAPRWSRTVLRWQRNLGWSRHAPYDAD